MLDCQILKCTRTSKGPAMPGPKTVALPDDEARALESKGDVAIVSGNAGTQEREQPRRHDRQMRRRMTR